MWCNAVVRRRSPPPPPLAVVAKLRCAIENVAHTVVCVCGCVCRIRPGPAHPRRQPLVRKGGALCSSNTPHVRRAPMAPTPPPPRQRVHIIYMLSTSLHRIMNIKRVLACAIGPTAQVRACVLAGVRACVPATACERPCVRACVRALSGMLRVRTARACVCAYACSRRKSKIMIYEREGRRRSGALASVRACVRACTRVASGR